MAARARTGGFSCCHRATWGVRPLTWLSHRRPSEHGASDALARHCTTEEHVAPGNRRRDDTNGVLDDRTRCRLTPSGHCCVCRAHTGWVLRVREKGVLWRCSRRRPHHDSRAPRKGRTHHGLSRRPEERRHRGFACTPALGSTRNSRSTTFHSVACSSKRIGYWAASGCGLTVAEDALRRGRLAVSSLSLGAMKRSLQWMALYASRPECRYGVSPRHRHGAAAYWIAHDGGFCDRVFDPDHRASRRAR